MKKREGSEIPLVAIVGYTNAGKSSIMNSILDITQAKGDSVFVKDEVFATLDTYVRHIERIKGRAFLLTDTVGFIRALPKTLLEAFKTTLYEATNARLIVHVVDISDAEYETKIQAVNEILKAINTREQKHILVYNKADKLEEKNLPANAILTSTTENKGIEALIKHIEDELFGTHKTLELIIPYNKGDILSYAIENTTLIGELEHTENGTRLTVQLSDANMGRLKEYII